MKKSIISILIISLITPNFVFAAWWNPITWSIWGTLFRVAGNQQTAPLEPIRISQTSTSTSPIGTQGSTTNQSVAIPQQPIVVKNPVVAPVDTTLCNGTYWNKCPSGEKLICPATGDAYCQVRQETPKTVSVPSPAPSVSASVSAPAIVSNSTPAITDEQKQELNSYLQGRLNIINQLTAFYSPLGNRNVVSYTGVLSRTVPQIETVSNEINALVIPTVSFSDLFANDQGLLLQLQSDFFHYALALEYQQTDPTLSLNAIETDNIQLSTSLQKIKTEIRKDLGDDYLNQISSYF